ncbi:MAG: MarR family transcriptional regulator [Clostridiales bacterium]|jgi:DNA-binding MarR family transcriptional regulator|nr:MarR family transcriptional regulator [Clostridiales bacterium]
MNLSKTISLMHRKMNTELNVRLRKIGLSNAMARLLLQLYHNGEMTQADLCNDLELDKSTVAKALVRMEEKGLVKKHTNPQDTRSFLVYLTPKAHRLVPKTQEILSSWSTDVTAHMSLTEKELFYELLHKAAQQATEICKN